MSIPDALEKVPRIRVVYFKRLSETSPTLVFLIAQEVQEVTPEAVREFDGYLTVTYGNLVGLLIKAVKELKGVVMIIAGLRVRVEALEVK